MNGFQIVEPTNAEILARLDNEIVLEIPAAPPSANAIWRKNPRGGMYLNKSAVDFHKIVKLFVGASRVPSEWPFYAVEIVVSPRRRSGDVDNFIKPTLDALTRCGFWTDDDRVAAVACRFGPIVKTGRTTIFVRRIEAKYPEK